VLPLLRCSRPSRGISIASTTRNRAVDRIPRHRDAARRRHRSRRCVHRRS
jgi:hypothetical protein